MVLQMRKYPIYLISFNLLSFTYENVLKEIMSCPHS
ncbi:hypothetical protein R69619_03740 [Paraburkholderia nemoris]|nr:hypothetical protein R69619_03740 [Paraburkholderia nemoris]